MSKRPRLCLYFENYQLRDHFHRQATLVRNEETTRFKNPGLDLERGRQQPPIVLHPHRRSCSGPGRQPPFLALPNPGISSSERSMVLQEGSRIHKSQEEEGEEDQERGQAGDSGG